MPLLIRPSPWVGQLAVVLAAGVVAVAPVASGGAHPWPLVLLTLAAAAALALHVGERALRGRPLKVSYLAIPFAIAIAASIFQLLPLPHGVRALLSPEVTERIDFVVEPLRGNARELVRGVLSVDPPETAAALLRLIAGLSVFVVLADRCRKREERELAFRVLLVGAAALVLVAVAHSLLRVESIYGLLQAPQPPTPLFAPLVNPNHLGRAFGALALLLFGRALAVRPRTEKAAFFSVGLACVACLFFTESRGAMLALVAAGVVFLVVVGAPRPRGPGELAVPVQGPSRFMVVGQLLALVVLAAGLFVFRVALLGEVLDGRLANSKLAIYGPALSLLDELWAVGAGNGGFRAAFTVAMQPGLVQDHGTYTHAENWFVQLFVDHGVVFGAALLAAGAWVLWRLLRKVTSKDHLIALPCLVFLFVGDLVDFSLELAFGTLLVAFALAMVGGRLAELGRHDRDLAPRWGIAGAAFALAMTAALSKGVLGASHWDVANLIRDTPGGAQESAFQQALGRHPHDAYYAYGLAVTARQRKDVRASLQWANRALLLRPTMHMAHVEAGHALFALGKVDQALLEYRVGWNHFTSAPILRELVRRLDDVDKMLRGVPEGGEHAARLCRALRQGRKDALALACYDRVANREGTPRADRRHRVDLALRLGDVEGAWRRAQELLTTERPLSGKSAALAAVALARFRGLEHAFERAASWELTSTERANLLEWRIGAAVRLGRHRDAHALLRELRSAAHDMRLLHRLDVIEAGLLAAEGRQADALRLWQRIRQRAPKDVRPVVEIARLEHGLGLDQEARAHLADARRIDATHPLVVSLAKQLEPKPAPPPTPPETTSPPTPAATTP